MIARIITLTLLCNCALQAAAKPNILFILCDDLGYGDVGVFHQNQRAAKNDRSVPYFTTPHIDAMAAAGMKMDHHYCAAPVCAPSRASLLTGLTQGHASVRDNQFDKQLSDTLTLASVVRQAGYATAAFGKWGLQGNPKTPEIKGSTQPAAAAFPGWPTMPTDRGFDYFLGYVRHKDGHFHYPVEDRTQIWENKTEISNGLDLCYTTDLFTAAAKRWIIGQNTQNPKQPFFAYLAFDTPHAKLQNPPCAYPDGGGLKGGVQWTGKPHAMLNTATGTCDGWMHPDYANATWDQDHNSTTPEVPWPDVQKRYANDVRRIDDCVGDLMSLLNDLNLADNTLVIFSSDNGPSEESYLKENYEPTFFHGFGPFEGIKRDTLEGGLREPTIARWPAKIKAGSSTNTPSGQWDWLATFADVAALPIPASSDGVSLLPTLTGSGQQQASALYCEYAVAGKTPKYETFNPAHRGKVRGQMQVVHVDGYKGLRTGIQSAAADFAIYDVTQDPKELHNLAQEPGFDKIQQRMKARALQCRLPQADAARPYDNALIPATEQKLFMTGVLISIKNGEFPWMPNLRCEPAFSAQPLGFVLPGGNSIKSPCAIKIESAIQIPADGAYTFSVASDSHTMLFVHDIRLLDENPQPDSQPRAGTLNLKAGWHPVQLLYRSGKDQPTLSLKLTGPDSKDIPLTKDNLKTLNPGW